MEPRKNFFNMPFWQSVVANIFSFFVISAITSGVLTIFFRETVSKIVRISKVMIEAQIYKMPDGTKIYELDNNIILERKDGTTEILPKFREIKGLHGKL